MLKKFAYGILDTHAITPTRDDIKEIVPSCRIVVAVEVLANPVLSCSLPAPRGELWRRSATLWHQLVTHLMSSNNSWYHQCVDFDLELSDHRQILETPWLIDGLLNP